MMSSDVYAKIAFDPETFKRKHMGNLSTAQVIYGLGSSFASEFIPGSSSLLALGTTAYNLSAEKPTVELTGDLKADLINTRSALDSFFRTYDEARIKSPDNRIFISYSFDSDWFRDSKGLNVGQFNFEHVDTDGNLIDSLVLTANSPGAWIWSNLDFQKEFDHMYFYYDFTRSYYDSFHPKSQYGSHSPKVYDWRGGYSTFYWWPLEHRNNSWFKPSYFAPGESLMFDLYFPFPKMLF